MIELLKDWKRLEINNPAEMFEASNTLHQAAQFIAMAGNYFIPKKADDSHTNAQWNSHKNWLIGNPIKTPNGIIKIALDYPLLVLIIANNNLKPIAEIALDGKTRLEVFDWFTHKLSEQGLDVSDFKPIMHYEIPDHPVLHGKAFKMNNPLHFMELGFYRTNGNLLLEYFTKKIKPGEPVRVWPHHFDDGSYLPMQFDSNGAVTGSISLGVAVADPYYPEPYFYVTTWKLDGINYDKLPTIEKPGFWNKKEWIGQVLKGSDIAAFERSKEQLEISFRFFKQATNNALGLIEK